MTVAHATRNVIFFRSLARTLTALAGAWLFATTLVVVGCGSASPPDPSDPPHPGDPDAGAMGCAAGELTRDDGSCQPAGLPPDMQCPPGELPLGDGSCQKAGVPASACAMGFTADGKDGCEAILPDDPCPPGQMAVPGDTACHEVAPCGSGTWGDIPVEANTQFVDQAYSGGASDGTQDHPWTTIQEGIAAAAESAVVAVAAGSYAEDVVIQGKPVRLWGRCPAMVEVAGADANLGTIEVLQKLAGGTEVRGLAVTGERLGMVVWGATGVVIEQVWLHDTGDWGVDIQDEYGATSVELRNSLVEQNYEIGVFVLGSDATLDGTVVRSTLPNAQGSFGRGIEVENDIDEKRRANATIRGSLVEQNRDLGVAVVGSDTTLEATVVRATQGRGIGVINSTRVGERANLTVRGCLVEENQEVGVFIEGSDASIDATVIRTTLPDARGTFGHELDIKDGAAMNARANVTVRASLVEQNHEVAALVEGSDAMVEATVLRATLPNDLGDGGFAFDIHDSTVTKARANVTIRACVVDQNHDAGVFVWGSDATIEATLIHSTLSDALGEHGDAITVEDRPETNARASVTIRACLLEQNHSTGVTVWGSDATIEATVIRSTLTDALGIGRGIDVYYRDVSKARANVTVRACFLEQNRDVGVMVWGADASIEATVIRSTLPDAQQKFGRGIGIQDDPRENARANVSITACLVDGNQDTGVFVRGSDVTITDTTVRDTAPRSDGTFGDGILVELGNVGIYNAQVDTNARAGVSSFGGHVIITGGIIRCNGFDLDGELSGDVPFSFDGSSGWQCSRRPPSECTELGDCNVVTTGIASPPGLVPEEPLKP